MSKQDNPPSTREELFHENKKLREALEFYADPKTHELYPLAVGYGWTSRIDQDKGEKARQALEIEEEKN